MFLNSRDIIKELCRGFKGSMAGRVHCEVACRVHTSLLRYLRYDPHALALSQNCEKRLLAMSCLSVLPSARNNSAPTTTIFMKCDT